MMEECYVYKEKKKAKTNNHCQKQTNVVNLEAVFRLLWDLYSFSLFNNQAGASPKTGGIVHNFEKPGGYKQ